MVYLGDKVQTTRKILGIPVLLFFGIIAAVIVIAGTIYLLNTITLSNAQQVVTTMPTSMAGTSGSSYSWSWNITNTANRDNNFTLRYSIMPNSTTLTNNEVRLIITNETDAIIAEQLIPANATYQEALKTDFLINSGAKRYGWLKVEFNLSSENDTYYLRNNVEPGNFKWAF